MHIAMTNVYVNDPLEAFQFYTQVLGFVEHTYMPEHGLAIVTAPEVPDTALLLEPNQNPLASAYQKAVYDAEMPAIVFGTADIRQEYARLIARGVVFRGEPETTEWGTSAVFEDTCGNLIQLHQA